MSNEENMNRCPKCQAPLPADAPQGLCAKCLLAAVSTATEVGQPSEKSPPPPLHAVVAAFPQLEIIELIGHGGMGVVYKARQPKLERFVALKLLSQSLAADPSFAERFHREARLLARLNHPNIVNVYDYGEAGGFYYLLMEYVDGINLRQALQAGRFTPQQALALVPRICEALQFAHDEGILHRDIKPENILLDSRGRIKIADFGIAKMLGDEQEAGTLTASGAAIGTPQYMAPEQLEHRKDIDQRADIYSLGVVFYEMLTGEVPMGRFAPPSEKSAVDPRVDEIVLRALAREREKRFASAGEVKTEVEHVTASDSGGSFQAIPPVPPLIGRRTSCYFSTPKRMRKCFPGPAAHILICKGQLRLDDQNLTFTSPWRTTLIIPLKEVRNLSLGQFKMWKTPWVMKYESFNFISVSFNENGQNRTYILVPVTESVESSEANTPYVADWFEAIRRGVTACAGTPPVPLDPAKISVSAQGHWNERALPLLVAGLLILWLFHSWLMVVVGAGLLSWSIWYAYGFLHANYALRRGDFDAVTSNDPPGGFAGSQSSECPAPGAGGVPPRMGPAGTAVIPEDRPVPPRPSRFWKYAPFAIPVLISAMVFGIIFAYNAYRSAKRWQDSHLIHTSSANTPPPEAVLERVTTADASRFPGMQAFRWKVTVPAQHVSVFKFTSWSNGVPTVIDGLSCWIAGRDNKSTKGTVQWNVQNGMMLNPELGNQERWDFRNEISSSGGVGGGSHSSWTRGILATHPHRDTGMNTIRLRAANDGRELFAWGDENLGVTVQALLEKIPSGMTKNLPTSGAGITWQPKIGEPGDGRTKMPVRPPKEKTIILTGVTNYLGGPYVTCLTPLAPGETLVCFLQYPDGRLDESISGRSTYRRKSGTASRSTLLWSMPEGFGSDQAKAALSQIKTDMAERPLLLKAGEPLRVFMVTNEAGAVLVGYIKYTQAVADLEDSSESSGPITGSAHLRSVTDIGGTSFYVEFSPSTPPGYELQATDSLSTGGAFDATTTWGRSSTGLNHHSTWHLPPGFGPEQAQAAETQLKQLIDPGAVKVQFGQPRQLFAVTNSSGEIYTGYFELFAAQNK